MLLARGGDPRRRSGDGATGPALFAECLMVDAYNCHWLLRPPANTSLDPRDPRDRCPSAAAAQLSDRPTSECSQMARSRHLRQLPTAYPAWPRRLTLGTTLHPSPSLATLSLPGNPQNGAHRHAKLDGGLRALAAKLHSVILIRLSRIQRVICISNSRRRSAALSMTQNSCWMQQVLLRFMHCLVMHDFTRCAVGSVINVRSASRVGRTDFGANRKRVEEVRSFSTAL